jgi:hypothetical protein
VSYLPDHTYDIFVSYAHGPQPVAGFHRMRTDFLSKWTHSFVDHLSSQLDITLGTKDHSRRVSIWMDPALDGNTAITKGLSTRIEQSALFLVVMSHFYLDSAFCADELKWFTDQAGRGTGNRIFVVKAFNMPVERWPTALKPDGHALPGYTFYHTDDPNDPGKPLGWPQPDDTDKAYWQQLWKLADEVASELKRMEWMASERLAQGVAKQTIAAVPARVGRTLFLGYMHDSLGDLRSELREQLDKTGFKVVPPHEEDPVDEGTARAAFDKYLPASDAVVLVANESSALWPKGQDGGPLGLQLQLAQKARVPVHLWQQVKDLTAVRNQAYRSFLANVEANARASSDVLIHADDISEFVRYISAKLDAAPKPAAGAEQFAVVCSNARPGQQAYEEFQDIVITALADTERSSIIADQDAESGQIRLMTLQDEILRADTVVVVCFDQEWNWAHRIILQLREMMGAHSAKTKIFVIGPEHRNKGKFVTAFKFNTVIGVTPDNRVPKSQVVDEIKKLLSGVA